MQGGRFVCRPVYIGVGTGEAYGVGTRSRSTRGRFRFYRYDVKDNFHVEYIRRTDGPQTPREDVKEMDDVTSICDDRATLLLGRGGDDGSFMCMSDPNVGEYHADWLKDHPHNKVVYQRVVLEKVRDDLRTQTATTPFRADDVGAVLDHTWRTHRLFFAAWQHPRRLGEKEGLDLYYRELPSFRREMYGIYRFRPELLGLPPGAVEDELTVPRVLWSDDLRARLEGAVPGSVEKVEKWLQREVVADLYAYGNHPELRLCTAIALWRRLSDSGLWDTLLEVTYREELYGQTLSPGRVIATGV
jgi:hypothetical protein